MQVGDTVKAVGLAALILALNMLATTAAIFVYAGMIEPGRPATYYQDQAPLVAAWTAPPGGALLFLAAMGWLGRRRPERNPFAFAFRAWLAYLVLDVGSGVAMGSSPAATFSWLLALSMSLALAGAMAGAALARPQRTAATA